MRVLRLNIGRICSCFSFIINIIKKIFGRGRGKNVSSHNNGDGLPTTEQKPAQGQTAGATEEWVDWGAEEQFSIKIEPSSPTNNLEEAAGEEQDLFRDMTPVFKKPKKIIIKKSTPEPNQYNTSTATNRLNFDMAYPPAQTDLGSWEDGQSPWDADGITEKELEWQTDKAIREKKQAERERRALDQQRKKEEREALRKAKQMQHLGTKLH